MISATDFSKLFSVFIAFAFVTCVYAEETNNQNERWGEIPTIGNFTYLEQPIPGLQFANLPVPVNDSVFESLETYPKSFFADKVAVVIGGSSGIGKSAALYLKRNVGFGTVVATSRKPKAYPFFPFDIKLWKLDVTDTASIENFEFALRKRFGEVHLIHFNAARVGIGSPIGSNPDRSELLYKTNYKGIFETFQRLLPLYPSEGYARVLATVSIANDQFLFPNSDGSFGTTLDFFEYYALKPMIMRRWLAIWAQFQNAKVNATEQDIPKNIEVSVVHPAQYDTNLFKNGLLLEDTQSARDTFENAGFQGIELPIENIGKAFGQVAQLVNPPLYNYAVDQTVDLFTPAGSLQQVFYRNMGYENDISVLISDEAWPPIPFKRSVRPSVNNKFWDELVR